MTAHDAAPAEAEKWRVHNEFAAVTLALVPHGRGTRLRISAGRVESMGLIDATVLEALTMLSESELAQIVAFATDPGNVLHREPSRTEGEGDAL
ncbi:hypothetical protein RB608_16430 [Nocardioides sp. LHD-245]|uniref:hypothetical protein n=1 Tax=Nocardioides sp. LHD-245 TaxID=3051387 RepID=UPI0027E02BD3|nr:hypothetical protein [Nocardioides sp. LHD-245]